MAATRQTAAIELTRTAQGRRDAARIWARATAVRAGRADLLDDVDRALAGIDAQLALPDAGLHLARRNGLPIGFVLLVPLGTTLHVGRLAVDPSHWDEGVENDLLAHVEKHARMLDFTTIDLWVVADDGAAITRYTAAGFRATTDVRDVAGRLQRRLELVLY